MSQGLLHKEQDADKKWEALLTACAEILNGY